MEKDIFRFQISMDDLVLMNVVQALRYLSDYRSNKIFFQIFLFPNKII